MFTGHLNSFAMAYKSNLSDEHETMVQAYSSCASQVHFDSFQGRKVMLSTADKNQIQLLVLALEIESVC